MGPDVQFKPELIMNKTRRDEFSKLGLGDPMEPA